MALLWAFGGSLIDTKMARSRTKFNQIWRDNFKKVVFPAEGNVLDYYYDIHAEASGRREFVHWSNQVEQYVHVGEEQFSKIFVPTVESTRISYLMGLLVPRGYPMLLVGGAGTGKTQLMQDYLRSMNQETHYFQTVNMNYYTDSYALQMQLEEPIEKKTFDGQKI